MLASETLSLFLTYAARKEAQHAFDLAAMLVGYGFSVSGEGLAQEGTNVLYSPWKCPPMHGGLPKAAWQQPQQFWPARSHQLVLETRLLPSLEGKASSDLGDSAARPGLSPVHDIPAQRPSKTGLCCILRYHGLPEAVP